MASHQHLDVTTALPSRPTRDINAEIASLLRDLAFAQDSEQRMFGYKRAASAVLALEHPLTDLRTDDGGFQKILGVGPASTRIIREVLDTGTSPTVEEAVARSERTTDILRRRALRACFLSRAQVLHILGNSGLMLNRLDYHGDLQMHSEWSDGTPTLTEIIEACLARGYAYAAVTDHSHGLKIAGGLSREEAADQRREIDRLNTDYQGRFRLIHGIEANIASDGRLDLSAEEAKEFELVLAAPHSKLRKAEDQTDRMIAAVRQPSVHILAHPRGRMSGSRAGVIADWSAVFAAAAEEGVAVEIDGDPSRQDLDYSLAARALAAGCLFALDSDAHTTAQLQYAETAVAHAVLAGIPRARIINYWDLQELADWMARRRGR